MYKTGTDLKKLPKALIITGPTCSGKSGLSLALAKMCREILHKEIVIINADAMQLYAPLRILTARPSEEDEKQAFHRLYGILAAEEPGSAALWRKLALAETEQALKDGHIPVLCGGSGMYLAAFCQGLAVIPDPDPGIRAEIRALALEKGPLFLHKILQEKDKEAAARLNPADTQRLARACEVVLSTGRSIFQWQKEKIYPPAPYDLFVIRISPPRESHKAAVRERFRQMLAAGLKEEVKALFDLNPDQQLPVMRAHGLPEFFAYWRGEKTEEEASEQTVINTIKYIKRQQTWFRHQFLASPERTFLVESDVIAENRENIIKKSTFFDFLFNC